MRLERYTSRSRSGSGSKSYLRLRRLGFSGSKNVLFHTGVLVLYTVLVRYVRPSYCSCTYGSEVPAQSLAARSRAETEDGWMDKERMSR